MVDSSRKIHIVGQGIAGTLAAWECYKRGIDFHVFDRGHQYGSSVMAAGLMNPVTGRRYVKTWLADELWPSALKTYTELAVFLGIKCVNSLRMLRFLQSAGEENDFSARMSQSGYAHLMSLGAWPTALNGLMPPPFSCGFVHDVYQVDLGTLLLAFRRWLLSERKITTENFISLNSLNNEQVIYCEGAAVVANPLFGFVRWSPNKGEALHISSKSLPKDLVIKQGELNIIPIRGESFWVGTKNQWNPEDPYPTPAARDALMRSLQDAVGSSFKFVKHVAGIRPAVRDRRPVVGAHPTLPNCFIINGFGTKGVSLAPFFVQHFFDGNLAKYPEVSPSRFVL